MDLTQLKAKGGVVSAALVKRPVEWKHEVDGKEMTEKFTVFVRRISFGAVERANEEDSPSCALISRCVCLGEKGEEALSYEDAFQLEPGLAAALVEAVMSVNNLGKPEEKNG